MKITAILLLTLLCAACGYKSPTTAAAPQPGTTPTISQLSPDSASSGTSGFMLTVNGSSFASNASVSFNGAAMQTTFVSGSQIMAAIPASAIATPATVAVTVTNPGTMAMGPYGGGTLSETSAAVNFTIN